MVAENEMAPGAEEAAPVAATAKTPKPKIEVPYSELEPGKYTYAGFDVDSTGRRLIDEIVNLSAYTKDAQFSQYVMPLMNLNPAARQRHQVRVITVGFFRMLKNMQTYKVVKTKTEIATLIEFLDWLETLKTNDAGSKGVVLIYHEHRKFAPYLLIESLKKYHLLDRFSKTVVSFADGYKMAEAKCTSTIQHFTLRDLAKLLLNREETAKECFDGSACYRARLAFEIAYHLANDEFQEETDDVVKEQKVADFIRGHAPGLEKEIADIAVQEQNLMRQNSLRPLFLEYFKSTLYHRVKAVTYRRILAELGYDFEALKAVWSEKSKDGMVEVVRALQELKEADQDELVNILDCHFDPDKQPLKPEVSRNRRRHSRGRTGHSRSNNNHNKENRRSKSVPGQPKATITPDSTSNSPKIVCDQMPNNSTATILIECGQQQEQAAAVVA